MLLVTTKWATRLTTITCMSSRTYSSSTAGLNVAIIGGGIAGLAAAQRLADNGLKPTVLDMGSRHPGGRACSREMPDIGASFDHGLQFLAPKSPEFISEVATWEAQGVVAPWNPRIALMQQDKIGEKITVTSLPPKINSSSSGFCGVLEAKGQLYVGVPSNGSIARHIGQGIAASGGVVQVGTKVTGMSWSEKDKVWRLVGIAGKTGNTAAEESLGDFHSVIIADALVVTPGSAGYVPITGDGGQAAAAYTTISASTKIPMFTLMVSFPHRLESVPFDAACTAAAAAGGKGPPFDWIARNSSKPGRPVSVGNNGVESWVAVTTPHRAQRLLKDYPLHVQGKYNPQTQEYRNAVAGELLKNFISVISQFQGSIPEPSYVHAQRWGRAFSGPPLVPHPVTVPAIHLAAAGDFIVGQGDNEVKGAAGFEVAWRSGVDAADQVMKWV